jgi:hypothetical protein
MVQIEQIAAAALAGDGLNARNLTQDFFRQGQPLHDIPKPEPADEVLLAASAALLELFAIRLGQPAPDWTAEIGPLAEPIYLLKAAKTMKRLRQLCQTESPEPLRKRGFYAPPNYLTFI